MHFNEFVYPVLFFMVLGFPSTADLLIGLFMVE